MGQDEMRWNSTGWEGVGEEGWDGARWNVIGEAGAGWDRKR